jgi:TRAP-type transport system periplasmic protein
MKNLKLFRFIILGLSLTLVVLLAACSGQASPSTTQAPAPAPAQTQAPAPAPASSAAAPPPLTQAATPSSQSAAAAKVKELKYADWSPASDPLSKINQQWADMINQKTNGAIHITTYFSESLLKSSEVYRGVQTGITDFSYYTIGNDVGLTELNRICVLPLVGYASMQMATAVYEKLLNEFPALNAEFPKMKLLSPSAMPPYHIFTMKSPVKVPEDLKGKKIIARAQWAELMKNFNAVPLELGPGDFYTSLDKGLAEGHILHYPAANMFKELDLHKYVTHFGEGGCGLGMAGYLINLDVWNSFTPEQQQIILDCGKWKQQTIMESDYNNAKALATKFVAKTGVTATDLTPDQIKVWINAAKPGIDKWMADNSAKGAKDVYNRAQQLIAEYAKNGILQ